jgi:hypothetical protein
MGAVVEDHDGNDGTMAREFKIGLLVINLVCV